MSIADAVTLVAIVSLVGLTAVLASAETVLTRVGLVRALALDEEGRRGSAALLWLIEHPARGLNVILFLTIAARIAAAALLIAFALRWGSTVVTAVALLLIVVSFVLAEVAPRTFTLRRLERTGLVLAPPVAATVRLLQPLLRPLVLIGGAISGGRRAGPFSSDEELRRLIGTADDQEESVGIEDDERAMIHSIFELGDTICREIMVPRPDMVTVSAGEDLDDVVEIAVGSGFSRIPVWEGERDEIIGVVYAKDLLQRLQEERRVRGLPGREIDAPWTVLVREPSFVPESKRCDDLLRELQSAKVHLAIVVDEHGAIVGLVTIEDIIEEIVGEIVDEYDHEEPPVIHLGDNRLRVSARLTVHDLNEILDADLPEDEGWDTVGGLLIGMLGRVPEPGESVQIDAVTLVAELVQGRRVSKVLVTVAEEDDREPEPAT